MGYDSAGRADLSDSGEGEGLRLDLIARIRREIAAGTYDTPEKLELALEQLLSDLDPE